jgi:hypothetical protein
MAPRRFAPVAMQAPLFGGPMPLMMGPMSPQLQHQMGGCVAIRYGMPGGPPPQQMLGPACYAMAHPGMMAHTEMGAGPMMQVQNSPLNSPMASPMMPSYKGRHQHTRKGAAGPRAAAPGCASPMLMLAHPRYEMATSHLGEGGQGPHRPIMCHGHVHAQMLPVQGHVHPMVAQPMGPMGPHPIAMGQPVAYMPQYGAVYPWS